MLVTKNFAIFCVAITLLIVSTYFAYQLGYDNGRLRMAKSMAPLFIEADELRQRQLELNKRIDQLQNEASKTVPLVNPWEN